MSAVKIYTCIFLAVVTLLSSCNNIDDYAVKSPDGRLRAQLFFQNGEVFYEVFSNDTIVLERSRLGVIMSDGDFSRNLEFSGASAEAVVDNYTMQHGKRKNCSYHANGKVFEFVNANGGRIDIQFRVSDDGVAFRYLFPSRNDSVKTITKEATSFKIREGSTAFLQPMSVAKTGWSKVNPCYEEFYEKEIPVGTPSPSEAGWVFPALFHTRNTWLLITEAGLQRNYCGARLGASSVGGDYQLAFPDSLEGFTGNDVLPKSTLPWQTPWRIITIGTLKTIIESDLGVALAEPSVVKDATFIKPGHSSWSWALLKDDSTVYDVQKRFVDYAADMQWDYCLVDADWDRKIGYEKIKQLSDYAQKKGVGLILWYNSAGDWNETPYTPKNKLLTREDRLKEFAWLKETGIKGVKIDFFGGDGQSMIGYYIDILEDAAVNNLLVNFHGATIPRGWHRTYPHLMSTEAIKGFEYVTFDQVNADEEPAHGTIIPFTRNAFDPMDFTPLSLDSVPRIARRTTPDYELALSVIFLSGIQHFVERPSGMKKVNEDVKQFLRDLPATWDDTKFVSGYPGKDVVIARRSGNKWWIAGINAENKRKTFRIDPSFIGMSKYRVIQDASGKKGFEVSDIAGDSAEITVGAHGGFVIVAEQSSL
jgi:hypothetical protein